MIELKNVSKYYYNKGIIATGFTKVNLKFNIGEFIAITGESGSGKSTLLNVISGIDSYEEGEMYINGKETSHYSEKDFENYRRKYIGHIYQNFNLVNSYTVYQNIELVLLLNGNKKKEIKEKVLELIKKVGLTKYKNAKVSKLSGGQKQRVAIARALAKETPIIIADEPTGSLDSKTAKSIIKLLKELSQDKLVIVVTHNYDQVEEYVTRKITMSDGRVLDDRKIKKEAKENEVTLSEYKNIGSINKLILGIRNTFNIIPKFILLLFVYLFLITSIVSTYASFSKKISSEEEFGFNQFFKDLSKGRIIINKNDKSPITKENIEELTKLNNVYKVLENDLSADNHITLKHGEYFYIDSYIDNHRNLKKVDIGRLPKEENEIVLEGTKDNYDIEDMVKKLKNKETPEVLLIEEFDKETSIKFKIVGIKYQEEKKERDIVEIQRLNDFTTKSYISDKYINEISFKNNEQYSKIKVLFQNKYYDVDSTNPIFKLTINNKVPVGNAYISSDNNSMCKNENCINSKIKIEVDNLYFKDNKELNISKVYDEKSLKKLLNITNYEDVNGNLFLNSEDYNSLFNKGNFQSSVYVKDIKQIDNVVKELNNKGYKTLKLKDTIPSLEIQKIMKVFFLIVMIILIISLFFISYFIIRLIMKSRNIYYSVLRMLGANKLVSRDLIIIELFTITNISILVFFILLKVLGNKNIEFIDTINKYLIFKDYAFLYIIIVAMSILIALRYAKNLFKTSAAKTLREEN